MSPVVCAVSLCALMLVLLPPVGRGITSPCFTDGANDGFGNGWACLRHGVTFEHRQLLPWAVKVEGMSINEAVYIGTAGTDGGRRWCEVDMVAMGWCCSASIGNEVSSCAGGVAARP
jgi:hypothetical protein